jgi:TonB family protein
MKAACAFLLALALLRPARAQFPAANDAVQSAKIVQTVTPDFPPSLYAAYSHGGNVRLVINVDAGGHLTDSLVIGSSAPRFAELAVAAVKQWKFEPARWRGEPVPVCITLDFTFQIKGVVVSTIGSDAAGRFMSAMFAEMGSSRLYALRELDHIPIRIRADAPPYPQWLADQGVSGEVDVGFYIDETGTVRLPFVLEWPENNLANFAVEAVRRWKFEPPLHNGHPVTVFVRQEFRFGRRVAP